MYDAILSFIYAYESIGLLVNLSNFNEFCAMSFSCHGSRHFVIFTLCTLSATKSRWHNSYGKMTAVVTVHWCRRW